GRYRRRVRYDLEARRHGRASGPVAVLVVRYGHVGPGRHVGLDRPVELERAEVDAPRAGLGHVPHHALYVLVHENAESRRVVPWPWPAHVRHYYVWLGRERV